MKKLAILCVSLATLALAACAADPMPAAPAAPTKRSVVPPGGTWEVTRADPVGEVTGQASVYVGQRLMLAANSAGDPAGRTCAKPVYSGWEDDAAAIAGPTAPVAATGKRPVMEITCDGQPFGTYIGLPDGTLISRVNDWLLTLSRAAPQMAKLPAPLPAPEAMKAEAMKPEPAPMPVEPAKTTMPVEPAKTAMPDKRSVVYLASYKTEASAKAGWKALAKKSPILAKQQPILTSVELPKKGTWVRLYGLAADDTERAAICAQLGKLVDECGSRLRE